MQTVQRLPYCTIKWLLLLVRIICQCSEEDTPLPHFVLLKIGLCFSINWQAQWNIRYCMHPKIPTYIVKCCSCMLSLFRHRFDIEIWSGNIERIPNRGALSVEWITHISHCVSTLWHLWPHNYLQLTFSLPTKAYKGLLSLLAFLIKTKGTVGLH